MSNVIPDVWMTLSEHTMTSARPGHHVTSEDLLLSTAARVLHLDAPHQELAAWLQYFVETGGMRVRREV
jgi:hypothetical protein